MGQCITMSGGDGTDLDVITATAADVRAGKVIVDKEGNPLTGLEPERGNWTGNVTMNGKITIPDGHHGGGGYVNGPSVTQRGAWNGSVGMNAQTSIPEGYHNGAGKVSGPSVAYQNADISGTDRANATNRSCWDGTICLGVRNNHYLNGVNWIQFSDPNFRASNFKKGVPIMGLTGTFEGYVPTVSDLYLRGNNIASFESNGHVSLDAGQITVKDTGGSSALYGTINFVGYSRFNIEFYRGIVYRYQPEISISTLGSSGYTIASAEYPNTIGNHTVSVDISSAQISARVGIATYGMAYESKPAAIYRIWLS